MAEVSAQGVHFSYETAGDGFPLVLVPGPQVVWNPYMPLLGELCRTIMYVGHDLAEGSPTEELHPSARAAAMLGTFLDILSLERVYLASQAVSWHMALHFALYCPERLEALVLIGARDVAMDAVCGIMSLEARLHAITVPTLVVSEAEALAVLPYADFLTERLPRCTKLVVSDATPATSSNIPALRLGHAVMRFLLHCERQRNLVRGASFLL
jgi:pimeloyl-ACP methyl ester carboxylesterase